MLSGMLNIIHGASLGLPKHRLGKQLIVSSRLFYCITSSKQLVLVREPAVSIGVFYPLVVITHL